MILTQLSTLYHNVYSMLLQQKYQYDCCELLNCCVLLTVVTVGRAIQYKYSLQRFRRNIL